MPKSLGRYYTSLALFALLSPTVTPAVDAAGREQWIGAWGFPATSFMPAAAPQSNTPPRDPPRSRLTLDGVTVRQLVRLSTSAERVRVRISNEFGEQAMRLGAVHVALLAADGDTVPGSDHALTFSGRSATTIPSDAPVLSDAIDWNLPALAKLAISIYLPDDTVAPAHQLSEYLSSRGNFAVATTMPGAQLERSGALVSEVEVVSPVAMHTLVTLGDSITEGAGSTPNAFRSWPDRLAERLAENAATRDWSVVNAGIGSNRMLHNNPGVDALARLDRDVLSVPGVRLVILLEGINDIGYGQTHPDEAVSADDIIAAYQQVIARAHSHRVAVIAGTMTPFEDSHYYAASGEQVREAVNHWIRTSAAFDGVIDFDAAMRDPTHPTQLQAALQRGDHLHPNDAGYAAMADAIDLKLLASSSKLFDQARE
jgi:lysophospholipase L1-like esterase